MKIKIINKNSADVRVTAVTARQAPKVIKINITEKRRNAKRRTAKRRKAKRRKAKRRKAKRRKAKCRKAKRRKAKRRKAKRRKARYYCTYIYIGAGIA